MKIEEYLNDKDRILHSDLANLLYTTGIIGTLLYIIFLIHLIRSNIKTRKSKDKTEFTILNYFSILLIFKLSVEGMEFVLNYYVAFAVFGLLVGLFQNEQNLLRAVIYRNRKSDIPKPVY